MLTSLDHNKMFCQYITVPEILPKDFPRPVMDILGYISHPYGRGVT